VIALAMSMVSDSLAPAAAAGPETRATVSLLDVVTALNPRY
jgi:hypothetical protein